MTNTRTMRVVQAAAGMLVLAAAWQVLSYFFPPYLFPPVPEIISDIRMLDLSMDKTWNGFAGGTQIPYLGIAAHTDWIEQNPALVQKLYSTYKAAGEYIVKHPEESAALIAPKSPPPDQAALVSLIKANDRLGMNVVGAQAISKQIEGVYKAGIDVGYLKKMPSNDTIYNKPLK